LKVYLLKKYQELTNIKQKVSKSKFFDKKSDKMFAGSFFLYNFATEKINQYNFQ